MNQSIPLQTLLILLACAGGLYLIFRFVRALEKSADNTKETADTLAAAFLGAKKILEDSTAATNQLRAALAPACEELKTNMAGVPRLLEMVAKIGSAQLEIMQQQRAEQAERLRSPFGKSTGPTPPRDAAAANLEYEATRMMRADGISHEEALLRMNPANAQSVWENNGLFEGWGQR